MWMLQSADCGASRSRIPLSRLTFHLSLITSHSNAKPNLTTGDQVPIERQVCAGFSSVLISNNKGYHTLKTLALMP